MAISKSLPLPLVAFITIHLMLLTMMSHRVNSSAEVSFAFDRFGNDLDIKLEGDASVSSNNNEIQLTNVNQNGTPLGNSYGRASYASPIRLWDSSTGEVAQISTSFNFFIQAPYNSAPADGLAFFIAPHDSTLPKDSYGGLLGLFPGPPTAAVKSKSSDAGTVVVAVEFDTFTNRVYDDPDYKHIGIDVNSIVSDYTTEWTYWENGQTLSATITYDPVNKNLRVVASYPSSSTDPIDFTHDIDLTAYLPEWVRVGFSGSTGANTQLNNIQSWSFNSNLVKTVERGNIASVV